MSIGRGGYDKHSPGLAAGPATRKVAGFSRGGGRCGEQRRRATSRPKSCLSFTVANISLPPRFLCVLNIASTGACRLEFIAPMEPKLVAKAAGGRRLGPRINFDGYRSQIIIGEAGVRSLPGAGWTGRPNIAISLWLPCHWVWRAPFHCEVIVLNEAGLSDFGALRKAITRRQHDPYFVALDLLYLNGHASRYGAGGPARYPFIEQAGLEGMVSRCRDSKYRAARRRTG